MEEEEDKWKLLPYFRIYQRQLREWTVCDVTSVHMKYRSIWRLQYRPFNIIYHKSEQNPKNITVKYQDSFLPL
jgi:hypothetical protein